VTGGKLSLVPSPEEADLAADIEAAVAEAESRDAAARALGGALGDPLADGAAAAAVDPDNGVTGQVNAEPLGALTGAPPRAHLTRYMLPPGRTTMIVPGERASRSVVVTAPQVGFTVYIGGSGALPGANSVALTPGLPYEVIIPGFQELYAITDAPVQIPVQVQVAALLIGDRERPAPPFPVGV